MQRIHSKLAYFLLLVGVSAGLGCLMRPWFGQTHDIAIERIMEGDARDAPLRPQPPGLLLQPNIFIVQDQATLDAIWRDQLKLAPGASGSNPAVSPPTIDFTQKTAIVILDVPQQGAERTLRVSALTSAPPYLHVRLHRTVRCASQAVSSRPYQLLVVEKTTAEFLVDIETAPFNCDA